MSNSISRQLVLWLAVPLMLLALSGALVHYYNSVAPEALSSDQRMRAAVDAVVAHIRVKDGRASFDADAIRPPLPSMDAILYAVRDSKGSLIAGTAGLPKRNVRTLTARVDTVAGMITIAVADLRSVTGPASRFGFMSTLLWDFIQLDVTLVLIWFGIQLGLRPLKKLRADIAARSPADLRPIDEMTVPREIASVAATLNRLFLSLASAVQSQRQFIANTAHQLRTPLAGLQAQLDLLIAEPAAEPVKHRLMTLQEGIHQLAHSANQLLTLARADPAVNIAAKNQAVALDAIVGEVAAKFFDRALQSNIDLGIEVVPVTIMADPALVDDLLSNLVDNALKYTPPGGSVTLTTGKRHGKPYLAIEDTGPGIPEADYHRVRQRFYRLPNSPGHGSGLGLAIVDEIARLYGAALTIGPGGNGSGTKVSLQFG